MKIKDRPEFKNKPKPFSLGPDEMVSVAIKTMASLNIGSVVILDDEQRVLGIVTERDLLRRLLSVGLDPAKTPLSKIMTAQVKKANPDDQVIDWLRQMSNERFRHVPVVDGDGRLINLMSQGDFVSFTWPELLMFLRGRVGDSTKNTGTQVPLLVGGIMLYSLAMLLVFKYLA